MVKAAIDTFISFSSLPIRAISSLGLFVSALSFLCRALRVLQPDLFRHPRGGLDVGDAGGARCWAESSS